VGYLKEDQRSSDGGPAVESPHAGKFDVVIDATKSGNCSRHQSVSTIEVIVSRYVCGG
jgi:hypothetical protein